MLRIYAIPDRQFESYLEDKYYNNRLSWNESNSIQGTLRVEFVYEGASNAVMLHPVTGRAPFWHPLANQSPNRVYDVKQIKGLLNQNLEMDTGG